jgi:DNA-binding beta-propeller fold protein YncE
VRRTPRFLVLVVLVIAISLLFAQNQIQFRHIHLPTSKSLIGPIPGIIGRLNGFTPTIAVSPDRRYAAFLNDGYGSQQNKAHQSIAVLNLGNNQLTDFPDDRLGEEAHQSYFIGLAFSSDGSHLYASMGSISDPSGERAGNTGNGIAVYKFEEGKIKAERFLAIPPQKIGKAKKVAFALQKTASGTAIPYPAGLAVIAENGKPDQLLVANNYSDNAVLIDSAKGRILAAFDLSTNDIVPSSFPYTCVASHDGARAWCSLWNASRITGLDLKRGTVVRWVPLLPPSDPLEPGSHPTAMLLSPDEKLLYVALANADRVIAVPTEGTGPMYSLNTNLPHQEFSGSCPSSLAVSADGKRLFTADACLDAVAVFDVSKLLGTPVLTMPIHTAEGFIQTDWYPTALATVGDDLLIATSKGQGTGPNNIPSNTGSERRHRENAYIPTLLYGSVIRVDINDTEKQLPELTQKATQNNLLNMQHEQLSFPQDSNPIRHVIYIIKENRTYDQVLGDLKVGNGDPSLTLYGADVTPNEHKLALQFGVLDNFYDSGEVSGDGHEWSTAAITTDYNENTWQIAYRSKERTYDFQGTVADEFPLDNNESDIDAPTSGYLWDNVAKHGLSYRDYGEFVATIWCKPERVKSPKEGTPSAFSEKCPQAEIEKGEALPANVGQPRGSASPWPWPVPMMKRVRPTKAALRDHFDPNFPEFNTEYPDQLRADEFLNEFDGFVRARQEKNGTELPSFVLLYLPDDHTHGTTPSKPKPAASVADNDLAVGRVVEAVSHSPYWNDTAILILEDDAQDGADHVDAHRSIAFVISKYSPGSAEQPFIEHGFYTTVNLIHTIEALLGVPPMNQNDAYAPILTRLFSGPGNQPPFTADWSNRDNGFIYKMNPPKGSGAEESKKMDFSRPDANNPAVLNAILWKDQKGDTPVPAPKHTVFPQR